MKTCILVFLALLFGAQQAWADEQMAVQPRVFDDLNGDGISDTEQKPVVQSNPDLPSEESVDAEQPIDPPSEGDPEGGEGQ